MKTGIFKYVWYAASVMSVAAMCACSSDEDDGRKGREERVEITLPAEAGVSAGELEDFYVRFTTDMTAFALQDSDNPSQNCVVSPLSAAMLFAMASNGLEPEQKEQYALYLGVSGIDNLNVLCATLLDKLPKADRTASFSLANSIWVNSHHGLTLSRDYSSVMAGSFRAHVGYSDFFNDNERSMAEINRWCAGKTGNMMTDYAEKISPDCLAFLLNALYFKAPWSDEIFLTSETKTATFHGSLSDSEVQMMESGQNIWYYSRNDDFEYLSIPFGNEAFSLKIILPLENTTPAESIRKLTEETLGELRSEAKIRSVKVSLPKFSIGSRFDINAMLKATGNGSLTENLPLTMFNKDITGKITYRQAATFSIDEQGAVASAATSGEVEYNNTMINDSDPVTVVADHPFLFFIEEYSTRACILSGYIANL